MPIPRTIPAATCQEQDLVSIDGVDSPIRVGTVYPRPDLTVCVVGEDRDYLTRTFPFTLKDDVRLLHREDEVEVTIDDEPVYLTLNEAEALWAQLNEHLYPGRKVCVAPF